MLLALQIVVATWGESQRDIEMVVQILEQVSTAPVNEPSSTHICSAAPLEGPEQHVAVPLSKDATALELAGVSCAAVRSVQGSRGQDSRRAQLPAEAGDGGAV